jgi:hypothetical protein
VSEMNTTTAPADGRPRRKTLSDQLDRLDGVIDDLSIGLNEAVAHAVERGVSTAVEKAVQGVLQAALATPEVARQLALATPAAPPAEQEGATTVEGRGFFGSVLDRASAGLSRVGGVLVPDGPGRRPLRLAAGAGVLAAAGAGAWLAAPYLAVAAGWVGGRVATLAGPLVAHCK